MLMGRAILCSRGKSTWTFRHCAWKPAKRSVMVWNLSRTASRWSRPFFRPKSRRLLEQSSLRRKRELLVLFQKCVFPVRAKNVMAVLDLIDHDGELSPQSLVQPDAEDLADAVGCQ